MRFSQKKILPYEVLKASDLIDDLPEVQIYRPPFYVSSDEPSGFAGIEAYWDVVDKHDHIVASFFCKSAAQFFARQASNRIDTCPDAVVIEFPKPAS